MTNSKKNLNNQSEKSKKVSKSELAAKIPLLASIMSAALIEPFSKPIVSELDFWSLVEELDNNIKEVENGDLSSMEAMLIAQAQALQTVFVSLGLKASSQTQLKHYTEFMTLALKAQSQSRATIQALIELKYPKQIAFVKQANIAHGHQQVNNGTAAQNSVMLDEQARAEKIENKQNELLEVNYGSQKMDIRATQTTVSKDKTVATVAK